MRLPLSLLVSLLLSAAVAEAAVAPSPSKAELYEWMDAAFAFAAKIPVDDRPPLARHSGLPDSATREERMQAALRTIALRPQYYGAYQLLVHAQTPRDDRTFNKEEMAADRAAAEDFVVELYRSRAGTANEEQLNWLSGLAELLLTTGRWKEALPLQRELVAHEGSTYARVALALMEKLEGNGAPYAEIMAKCPDAPEGYGDPDAYCGDVTRSLLNRMTSLVPVSQHPPAVVEILTGKAVPAATIEDRLHGIHVLLNANRAAAEAELNALLTSDAPRWAKNDALLMLMDSAAYSGRDSNELLTAIDCYLAHRGATVQSMTAAQWQGLLMRKPPAAEKRFIQTDSSECMQHHGRQEESIDTNLECLVHVLQFRHIAASSLREHEVVRQTTEWLAALVASSGRGLVNLSRMMTIGSMNVPSAEARQQIQQYVAQLPATDGYVVERSTPAVRQQTKRVGEPWAASEPKGLRCSIKR
ncbi:MAG TPA: hypothetical protein VGF28_24870 [Thermoanaerobaculia bacterium]|jgi:hypothetical protein